MRLNEIFETYKNDVQFQLIYVREAHPADGWQTPQNLYEEVVFDTPATPDEPAEIGHACQIGLELKYPMLIDTIDDAVEAAYVAAPIRLYVIDADGIITFVCGEGPHKFDPEGWEEAIKEQIARH